MKMITTSIFFTILFISCKDVKQKDCSRYKNGLFFFKGHFDNSYYLIDRNGSLQVQTDTVNKTVTKSRVRWINDCEYELTYLSGYFYDSLPGDVVKQAEPVQNGTFRFSIIGGTDKYYLFESLKGNRGEYIDTMWIKKGIGGFKPAGSVFQQ